MQVIAAAEAVVAAMSAVTAHAAILLTVVTMMYVAIQARSVVQIQDLIAALLVKPAVTILKYGLMIPIVLSWALYRGLEIGCGCFGAGMEAISYSVLIRALVILLLSLAAYIGTVFSKGSRDGT